MVHFTSRKVRQKVKEITKVEIRWRFSSNKKHVFFQLELFWDNGGCVKIKKFRGEAVWLQSYMVVVRSVSVSICHKMAFHVYHLAQPVASYRTCVTNPPSSNFQKIPLGNFLSQSVCSKGKRKTPLGNLKKLDEGGGLVTQVR